MTIKNNPVEEKAIIIAGKPKEVYIPAIIYELQKRDELRLLSTMHNIEKMEHIANLFINGFKMKLVHKNEVDTKNKATGQKMRATEMLIEKNPASRL